MRIRPESARPRVWWHWMNGNITKEGIKLDLEWMHRVGLGGFQNFDAALVTPQVVDHRLAYMTPEWKDAFKYATIARRSIWGWKRRLPVRRAGARPAARGSRGSQAMKKYVWSETRVEGGKPFTGTLAHPPSNTGAFQNLGIRRRADSPERSRRRSSMPTAPSLPIERRQATCPSRSAPENYFQRRQHRHGAAQRRRPGEDDRAAQCASGRRKGLDSI